MDLIRALLLMLLSTVAAFAEVIPVDVLIDFEQGSDGDEWSTTTLGTVTRGTGVNAWTSTGGPVDFEVSTTASTSIYSPFWIRGTAYENGSGDTRGFRIDMVDNDEAYFTLPFTATHSDVTVSFDIRCTIGSGNPQDATCDLFSIQGSNSRSAVLQLDAGGGLQLHTGSGPAMPNISSDITTLDASKWYRCTLSWDQNNQVALQIWDRADMSYLGGATLAMDNNPATGIRLGNEPHGVAVTSFCYYDNIAIDWTAAKMPLGPGSGDPLDAPYYVRTDGNNSNTGLANNSGGAFLTIAQAESIASPGDIIRIQAGSYDAGTTIDVDGASGAPITFVGDGAVITRNLTITGDYIQVVNLDFTHFASNSDVTPIITNDNVGTRIIDCYFYETGHGTSGGEGGGIRLGNVTSAIFRGNVITLAGTNGDTGTPTNAKDFADYFGKTSSDNVLIEYNSMSHSAEYMNLSGTDLIVRNNVYGPTTTSDWGGTPHIDALQFNAAASQVWFGDNWHVENATDDAHLYLCQYDTADHVAIVRNVSIRSGDRQTIWVGYEPGTTTHHFIAHNTIADSSSGPSRTVNTARPVYFRETSDCAALNNAFFDVTTSATPYQLDTNGTATRPGPDLMWTQGTPSGTLIVDNPDWVTYSDPNYDVRPLLGSPLIDVGGGLTTVSGSGTGTTITVAEDDWFHDGVGLTVGSKIYVGGDNNLTVTAINRGTSVITINQSITYSNGEAVGYAYRGSGPDIGPYEYGDTLLTGATISNNGNDYTVSVAGDALMVVFYINGIPQAPDYEAPYTITSARTVTAKAYALHPQSTPVFTAQEAIEGGGATRGGKTTIGGAATSL